MSNQIVPRSSQEQPLWLNAVTEGNRIEKFPYHYAVTKSKQIRLSPSIYPLLQEKNPPKFKIVKKIDEPIYILNIPFCASVAKKEEKNSKLINKLFTKISEESFYQTDGMQTSSEIAKKRIFVIIGINRPYSIDSTKNDEFVSWIENFPKCKIIKTFVVGKFWHPKMCQPGTLKALKSKEDIALEEKALEAFKLLKAKDPKKATDVQEYLKNQKFVKTKTVKNKKISKETKETRLHAQIPYQQIRDWLIEETSNQNWLVELMELKRPPLIYLGCMDGDTVSLKRSESGLMQYYDEVIDSTDVAPMLMSTGYVFPSEVDNLSSLSNTIDMKMRTKIAEFFPLGIYYPEPNFFLLLNEFWEKKIIKELSFVGGPGNDTESRRCIENLEEFWDLERIHFAAEDCLTTAQPPRMVAKEIGDFSKGFDVKDLSEDFFNSLRSISQTHLKAKVWASNMYIGLLMSGVMKRVKKISDIHGPLMRIFTIFDFAEFFKDMKYYDYNKKNNFTIYENFLEGLQQIENRYEPHSPKGIDKDHFSYQFKQLKDEVENLKNLNICEKDRIKIIQTAAASGKSVYDTLSEHVRNFPKKK